MKSPSQRRLPAAWVDELFRRLTVRYGRPFADAYDGLDLADVKADWAEVLGGFAEQPEAIEYALEQLPERPVNATQFRAIARQAPARVLMRLPEPVTARPDRVAAAMDDARRAVVIDERSPAQKVVDGIIERLTSQATTPSRAQREFMAKCQAMLSASDPRRSKLRMLGFDIPGEVVA